MNIGIKVIAGWMICTVCSFSVWAATETTPPAKGKTIKWAGCGITKQAFMDELTKAYERKSGIKIVYDKGDSPLDGSISGIQDVNNNKFELGGSCRTNLESLPDERNVYQVPVAWDAIVFITHPSNPVSNITTKQAQDIYLGNITNWKQLGGADKSIELVVRRGKLSGVGRSLRELLFANYDQEFPGARKIVESTGPLEKAITETQFSLGATGISSAQKRAKDGKVKILTLNDKEPTFENIKSGQYVMYRPLYLVTKGASANKDIKDFITYALSREGQEVIRKTGTVPYSEAMGLVMKQVQQYDEANAKGLFNTTTTAERKK